MADLTRSNLFSEGRSGKGYNKVLEGWAMRVLTGLVGLVVWVGGIGAWGQGCPPHESHISMASGSFSSQPGVTFDLKHFAATLVPASKVPPGCFQRMTVVSHAEIFVSNASLTQVFAEKLGATESKIKGFSVQNGVGKVTLSGKITKVIPVQFSISGPVTTDGASLLMDAREIKADGIPVKALLGLVGEHLSSVLGMKGVNGVSVNENVMSFSPEQIAHLKGYITGVETTSEGLTLRYGRRPGKGAAGRLGKPAK